MSAFDNPVVPLYQAILELVSRRIEPEKVLGLPALFNGAKLISHKVASIPCSIVKQSNGMSLTDDNHPSNWLLQRPNRNFGRRTLFALGTLRALLEGNAYFEITWDQANAVALTPIDSRLVRVRLVNGELAYEIWEGDYKRVLGADKVLHIKNLTRDGYIGISVCDTLCDALQNSLAIQRYSSTHFKKMAQVGYVIETPGTVTDEAKKDARKNMASFALDSEEPFGLAFAQGGSKLQTINLDAEKAQLLQSREFDIVTISNALGGVPPHKLGSAHRNSSYASLLMEEKAFLVDCVSDWQDTWAEEIELKLLTEYQKRVGSHSVEWDNDTLLELDVELKHKLDLDDLNNGAITQNEYNAKKNLPRIEEPFADMHRMPVNIGYAEIIANAAPGEPIDPKAEKVTEDALNPTPDDVKDFEPADAPIQDDALRFQQLYDSTIKRLDTRLRKAFDTSVRQRTDIDIDAHVKVCIEAIPFWDEAKAKEYIQDTIKRFINE